MCEKTPIDTISRYFNFLRVNPESCIICLLIDVVLGNRDDFQVRIYAKAPPNKVVLPAPSYVNLFGKYLICLVEEMEKSQGENRKKLKWQGKDLT